MPSGVESELAGPSVSHPVTFLALQIELLALVQAGDSVGEWWLRRCEDCGMCVLSIPLPPPYLPCPSNPLFLNGAAPLILGGNVSIAVKFLYYCLLIFI